MDDSQMTRRAASAAQPERLEMRWLPVTDARGATHMQAVWIDAGAPSSAAAHHAA